MFAIVKYVKGKINMSTTTKFELSLSSLADPEQVSAELDRIYKEFASEPDEKAVALTGLVDSIRTTSGTRLGDEILDSITSETTGESETAAKRRKILGALTGAPAHPEVPVTSLEIEFDTDTFDVRNIFRRTVLPDESERSVQGKRNMQNRMPSGPKQNDLSGGISRIDPDKRH